MTIFLQVGAGIGNHGNDASLEAAVEMLRRRAPGARLVCLCDFPEHVPKHLDLECIAAMRPPPKARFIRALNRLLLRIPTKLASAARAMSLLQRGDTLLFPGTGLLDDIGDRPLQRPLTVLMWSACARLRGVPVLMVSVGAGPMRNAINRLFLRGAAAFASYRSYRDEASRSFMAALLPAARSDRVYPDLVFGLHLPRAVKSPRGDVPPLIAIGLIDFGHRTSASAPVRPYVERIAELISAALSRGWRIKLVCAQSDLAVLADIAASLENCGRMMDLEKCDIVATSCFATQSAAISDADLLIAMRYHTAITGLLHAMPTISIGYERKFHELMRGVGLASYFHDIEQIPVQEIVTQIDQCLRDSEQLTSMIETSIATMRAELDIQEALIAELLSAHSSKAPHTLHAPPLDGKIVSL